MKNQLFLVSLLAVSTFCSPAQAGSIEDLAAQIKADYAYVSDPEPQPPASTQMSLAEIEEKAREGVTLCHQVTALEIDALNTMRATGRKETAIPFALECRGLVEKACAIANQLETASKFYDDGALQSASIESVTKCQKMLVSLKEVYAALGLQY